MRLYRVRYHDINKKKKNVEWIAWFSTENKRIDQIQQKKTKKKNHNTA